MNSREKMMGLKVVVQRRRLLSVMLFLILSVDISAVAAITPLEQIRTTVQGIVGIMRNQELRKPENRKKRRDEIVALVNRRFDFEEMSKLTLAYKWRDLDQAQKKQFETLFAELLKDTYIGRIDAYSNEEVVFDREIFDGVNKARALVYTKILKNNREIPINYKLVNKNGEWFVYDVFIEGVSLVRNYRSEFIRIINEEKFPGLIKRMQEKIVTLQNKKK